MKKLICLITIVLSFSFNSFSQVHVDSVGSAGVGTQNPDASAILELQANDKGFLPPRMSTTERDAIANPAKGLIIYNTDDNCIDSYDGSSWIKNCGINASLLSDSISTICNQWIPKQDFTGTARSGAASFTLNGKIYVGTGLSVATFKKDFYCYDPATDTWTQLADFGGNWRKNAVGFSVNGKGYIGLGAAGSTEYSDFWCFDPDSNSWTPVAAYPGGAWTLATSFVIGDFAYVGTGFNSPNESNQFYKYDPVLNMWSPIADYIGVARYGASSFVINGKAYVGTGRKDNTRYSDMFQYDPVTNSWSSVLSFQGEARWNAVAFSVNGFGILGGGQLGTLTATPDFWYYNPMSQKWTELSNYPGSSPIEMIAEVINNIGYVGVGQNEFFEFCSINTIAQQQTTQPNTLTLSHVDSTVSCENMWSIVSDFGGSAREHAVSFSIGDNAYVGTGFDGSAQKKDFYEYDSNNDTWSSVASMSTVNGRQDAVGFSLNGKGYVTTGLDVAYLKDLWLYDPGNNSWTQKSDFGGSARAGAVSFILNGKAYVGTGNIGTSSYFQDFWCYDSGANSWSTIANFTGVARTEAVVFTLNGKAYVGTGYDGTNYTKDFWCYDPNTNLWTQVSDFAGTARSGAVAFVVNGRAYVGAGFDGTTREKNFYEYDPIADNWVPVADYLGNDLRNATAFSVNDFAYVTTGSDSIGLLSANRKYCGKNFDPVFNYSFPGITTPGGGTVGTIDFGTWILDGDHMYNSNSGNVSIGTDSAEALFHVKTQNSPIAKFEDKFNDYVGISDKFIQIFESDSLVSSLSSDFSPFTTNIHYSKTILQNETDFGDLNLTTKLGSINFETNSALRLTIDTSGFVGINNSTPTALLDVGGDILVNGITIGTGPDDGIFGQNTNTAVGFDVLKLAEFSSNNNTGIGISVLDALTINGDENTGVGAYSLSDLTTGSYNTAVGSFALANTTTANNNTAVGRSALFGNTTGYQNTAIGAESMTDNIDGFRNTAVGWLALDENTSGKYNTGIGYRALVSNTTGNNNTAVGRESMINMVTTTFNTALGYNANTNPSANANSTGIGYNADPTASNRVRVGDANVTQIGGQVGWSTLSDSRFKNNITEEDVIGLDFINALRPVVYNYSAHAYEDWKEEKYGERLDNTWEGKYDIEKIRFSGFIAQEVEQAAKQTGYNFSGINAPAHDKDTYALRYSEFVVPLVKAVQEQQAIIESQNLKIEQLTEQLRQVLSHLKIQTKE